MIVLILFFALGHKYLVHLLIASKSPLKSLARVLSHPSRFATLLRTVCNEQIVNYGNKSGTSTVQF